MVPTLPRIVIDTNVLLGLWIFSEPSLSSLRAALDDGTVTAVRCTETDGEFAEVLARPDLLDVDPARQQAVLESWRARAVTDRADRPCALDLLKLAKEGATLGAADYCPGVLGHRPQLLVTLQGKPPLTPAFSR